MRSTILSIVLTLVGVGVFAQNAELPISRQKALQDFQARASVYGLTSEDVKGAVVSDFYRDRSTGNTHAYIQQYHYGLPILNAIIGLHYDRNHKLAYHANNFVKDALGNTEGLFFAISPEQMATNALASVNSNAKVSDFVKVDPKERMHYEESGQYYYECYFYNGTVVQKACNFIFFDAKTSDWWNIIAGANGTILDKISWTSHCAPHAAKRSAANGDASYHALSFTTESPLYGNRTVLLNPHDSVASPFGWQDIDGVAGADFTTTIGNNVLASEDRNADNQPGNSPDAGSALEFDFSYDPLDLDPVNYQDYAVTNLFVANNLLHDILYHYGFDENSGNFQSNTYSKGGLGSDEVIADAQDGSGVNNANFSTPPDGSNPRMQMYIWDADGGENGVMLNVTSPGKTKFRVGKAQFGAQLTPTVIAGKMLFVNDGVGDGIKGCKPLKNGTALKGNIAAIERGGCLFTEKVYYAQLAGAIAVVVLDTFVGDQLLTMSGSDSRITIPAVIAKYSDANELLEMLNGGAINIQLYDSSGFVPKTDSDLDLGVIAHEYGHGVSNRLTCGPSNTSALNNAEQMGEGWSDYIGLALTVKSGDIGSTPRGIGNWLIGQNQSGSGIRTYPYTTNMSKNPHTYKSIKTASSNGRTEVHYLGEVWCTMLWDLHWKMVEKYGYDNDLYRGTGGNNKALQLVMDGMKIQKCNPGFVDGRNAILAADSMNNGAANSKLIWEVFARRGLGFSASQGSSFNTADGVEAFDLPSTGQQNAVAALQMQLASIRPNPADHELLVEPLRSLSLDQVHILDLLGKEMPVTIRPIGDGAYRADLSDLAPGVYLVHIMAGSHNQTFKFQKN